MTAAQTLARGRRGRNWWLISFFLLLIVLLAREYEFRQDWMHREKIALIDTSTGEEVVQPVIDSESDPKMLDLISTWCVQAIEDRNPAGLDHSLLVPFLFNPEAEKNLMDDWAKAAPDYNAKQMRSKVEIISRHHQPVFDKDGAAVISTLIGQEINNGYDGSGRFVQEVKKVRLVLTLRANPYRQHKNRYQLACFGFEKTDITGEVAAK